MRIISHYLCEVKSAPFLCCLLSYRTAKFSGFLQKVGKKIRRVYVRTKEEEERGDRNLMQKGLN